MAYGDIYERFPALLEAELAGLHLPLADAQVRARLSACYGALRGIQSKRADDAREFLAAAAEAKMQRLAGHGGGS